MGWLEKLLSQRRLWKARATINGARINGARINRALTPQWFSAGLVAEILVFQSLHKGIDFRI
jgi:hypothetical protein